jgi:arsenate reductase
VEGLQREHWDLVVTVCDDARESCPLFLPEAITAHWGMPDPAAVEEPTARHRAFAETLRMLRARIAAVVALPVEELPPTELKARIDAIPRGA